MINSAGVKRHFIDVPDGQLHLRVAGRAASKPAILCLHMMPKSSRGFVNLIPELAKDRLVIAPDYPGYGESDPFTANIRPTIGDYSTAMDLVVDHFALSEFDIVGYHTGSMIAVDMAHRLQNRVRKIINISAPILTKEEIKKFSTEFSPIPLDEAGTRFHVGWERILHFRGSGMTLQMAAESMAENLRGGERYEDGHQAAFAHAPRYAEQISELKQPLWVMNLGDDLYEHSKRVNQYLVNGWRTDYPDWGHGCLQLWPHETAAEMLNFLDNS